MAVETIDIVPEAVEGDPILTRGDAEFWGPPLFRYRMWLEHRNKIIYLRLSARWEEPKGDNTTFQFTARRAIFDVRSRRGPEWYFQGFKEQYDLDESGGVKIPGIDKGMQEVYRSNAGLVAAVFAEGDRYGGPFGAGDEPKIRVEFNRVYFDIANV